MSLIEAIEERVAHLERRDARRADDIARLKERIRHVENWQRNRDKGLCDPSVVAARVSQLEVERIELKARIEDLSAGVRSLDDRTLGSSEPDGSKDRADIAPMPSDPGRPGSVPLGQAGYPSGVRCDHCGGRMLAFPDHFRCFGCGDSLPLPPDGSKNKADIVPVPTDPDAPRRFRYRREFRNGRTEWEYGVYWSRSDRHECKYSGFAPGRPEPTRIPGLEMPGLEWLDPAPVPPEPDGLKDRADITGPREAGQAAVAGRASERATGPTPASRCPACGGTDLLPDRDTKMAWCWPCGSAWRWDELVAAGEVS